MLAGSRRYLGCASFAFAALALACGDDVPVFDARDPASGPGVLAGQATPITDGRFTGGSDVVPSSLSVTPPEGPEPPDCDAGCKAHCADAGLANPVNRALCESLWGVGLTTRPIAPREACRRLYVDTQGRFPSLDEARAVCGDRPWGDVVHDLIGTDAFVALQRRRWADKLLYNNEALSPVRIYDADVLVDKLYRGLVSYDAFGAVIASHPVIVRRYATPGDRAEAAFRLLLGRPPFERERADLARLYTLWSNDYVDHPSLGRVPDAFIRFRCVDDEGRRDPAEAGECASTLWGYHELVLESDARARDGRLWSGLLTADEWHALGLPGRILSTQPAFWETAVDDVLETYLGYDLATRVPAVREALVDFLLANEGDIRAVHFAVLTSLVYLQSAQVAAETDANAAFRFTWGPLKQADAEAWLDTLQSGAKRVIGACDPRLPDPDRLLYAGTVGAYALLAASRWPLYREGKQVDDTYASLARTLGGCPENLAGGRFKAVSILGTATQESFVMALCDGGLVGTEIAAPIGALVPAQMAEDRALDGDVASAILVHQTATFFAREPSLEEYQEVTLAAGECAPKPCTAKAFARPLCFALLAGAEMLFY